MKRYLGLIMMTASLLLAACVPPAPTAVPTEAPTAPAAASAPAASSAVEPAAATLTANPWQWTSFTGAAEQFKVEQPANYLLTFQADGTAAIVADCNNAFADYTADAGALTIKPGPMTLAACPSGSRGEQFVTLLGSAARYFFADGALFIDLLADAGVMRLDPAAETAAGEEPPSPTVDPAEVARARALASGLQAQPWKWSYFATATKQGEIETPASYLVTFHDDGAVEIKADCNRAGGKYTLDGGNISIEIGPTTLAACPGDSRGEQFIAMLGDVAQFEITEGSLFFLLKTEGSTLLFDAAPPTVVDLCGEQALALNTLEDTLDPKLSASLDEVLVGLVKEDRRPGPGAVMLVTTPQGRYLKSIGVADVTTCQPLPADSPYQIGSNTKLMTSAILFQLQEEGVLSISDPLSKWLPDLAAKLTNGDKMTIEMMLTHTTGMKDYFDVPTSGGSIADGATDKAMLTRAFTPEELVKLVADSGLSDFEPGAEGQWNYSNTGYMLLGLIIEKASGKTYEENLKERIFEPLGLEQTYLQAGQPEAGALPQAYYKSPFDFTTSEWNASQGWSAGAVVSTPDEFATFMKALFIGKLFKQPETLKLMETPAPTSANRLGPGVTYAHGMTNNNGVLGHGGQTLGFQSDGGYIPDKDVTIVIWSNAAESNASRALVPAIANIVTGAG